MLGRLFRRLLGLSRGRPSLQATTAKRRQQSGEPAPAVELLEDRVLLSAESALPHQQAVPGSGQGGKIDVYFTDAAGDHSDDAAETDGHIEIRTEDSRQVGLTIKFIPGNPCCRGLV